MKLFGLGLLLVLLGACVARPPVSDWSERAAQARREVSPWPVGERAEAVTYLNALIASPRLDRLIARALAANPGLQRTWLTLRVRQARMRSAHGARWPSLEASASANPAQDQATTYASAARISWQVDVWRRLGDEARAAEWDFAQQQALTQATRDSLVAEVMIQWLDLIAQQRALEIERQRLATLRQNETLVEQRFRAGLGTLEALLDARASRANARANARANVLAYQAERDTLQREFRGLLGEARAPELDLPADFPEVRVALAELPEQTLARRPDLQAAFLAIQAADARRRAAYKDLLPGIHLQAALSDGGTSLKQALLHDPLWSLLGQLTAPIFQGGQLRAAASIAELETAQAYQTYRETLLTAVTEVEQALAREQSLARQQQAQAEALTLAEQTLAQYRQSYVKGLAEMPEVLAALRQAYDAKAQFHHLIHQRLRNRVHLGLALGLAAREDPAND